MQRAFDQPLGSPWSLDGFSYITSKEKSSLHFYEDQKGNKVISG